MQLHTGNLFSPEASRGSDEQVDVLVHGARVDIERIVSMGHASPAGFWYDDTRAEWVALLSGAALLEFEADGSRLEMRAGDYLLIEPHCRHRVAWTHPDEPSVWLAVYHER